MSPAASLKILVIGLGSMGKRRVRNLHALGVTDITGCDPREDRRTEAHDRYGIRTCADIDVAFAARPDVIVVSTPPNRHLDYALRALHMGIDFFTEAGVPDSRLPQLIAEMRDSRVIGMPSSTMRFFPGPKRIKAIVCSGEVGRPLTWHYHSGQYLPDWHPWESVESFYVANAETGPCREIVPFELTWLVDVFGPVRDVSCQRAKLTELPVEGDDLYQLQLRHECGVFGQLTVDAFSRAAVRHIRVVASEGTIEWDAAAKTLRTFRVADKTWRHEDLGQGTIEAGYVNPEEPYIDEMRQLLACVAARTSPPYTYADDLAVLDVLRQAERSSDSGMRVSGASLEAR